MEEIFSAATIWGMNPKFAAILIMSLSYLVIFTEKINGAAKASIELIAKLVEKTRGENRVFFFGVCKNASCVDKR